MNLFVAAVYSNGYMKGQARYEKLNDYEKGITDALPNILESYHYINKEKIVEQIRSNNGKVFLDSGAFSAFTLGATIDLPTYCNYIKKNEDIIRKEDGILMASVLDGIGDPLKTWQNQKQMESLGATPLPCFHFGEDERYLEYYINNYEYITIGGMVPYSTRQLFIWLDRIWDKYLIDGSGNAKIKIHGFGLTSFPLMEAYPWYSVDSSSWIQVAAFGNVITHDNKIFSVSDKSPTLKKAGQHVENMTKIENREVKMKFDQMGFQYDRLASVYESRAVCNLKSFGEINKSINNKHENKNSRGIQYLF